MISQPQRTASSSCAASDPKKMATPSKIQGWTRPRRRAATSPQIAARRVDTTRRCSASSSASAGASARSQSRRPRSATCETRRRRSSSASERSTTSPKVGTRGSGAPGRSTFG